MKSVDLLIISYPINLLKNFNKFEYQPKEVQSQLSNMIVWNLDTFNTDRGILYSICLSELRKLPGKHSREGTQREYEKCRNDCIVFRGTDCINFLLGHILELKGETKWVNNKVVNWNLYLLAHKGCGSDSYVVLINLPQWRTIVSLIKNGSGIVSLKIFNGYLDQAKKNPHYVHFRCGLFNIEDFLKKYEKSYKLQPCSFKQK